MSNQKYYKHPEYGFVYGESVPTPRGRLCWPYLVKARPGMQQKDGSSGPARFEVTLALSKTDPKVKSFLEYIQAEATAMLAQYNEGKTTELSIKAYLKDGDTMDAEDYPYYQGCWILTARNQKPIEVVDDAKGDMDPSTIKGGMIGRLMVTPLITAHGLSYKGELVQFIKDDGTRFAGGSGGKDMKSLLSNLNDDDDAPAEEAPVAAAPVQEQPKAQAAQAVQKGKAAALARL